VAVGLKDSFITMWFARVDGPVNDDLRLVWRTFNACFNVETWLLPANDSRAGMLAACWVDLKMIGGRARTE
jgi:hypothetical protein